MRRFTKAQPIGGAIDLQLLQFEGIFRWQRVRDGGDKLRDLHEGALETAQQLRQVRPPAPRGPCPSPSAREPIARAAKPPTPAPTRA